MKGDINKFMQWPYYSKEETNIASAVIRSNKVNYWTGNKGKTFEREFSILTGAKYSLTMANGTLALESALIALSIKINDEVIVTPRSYIASASCIFRVGAKPVFVDVEESTGNIDPDEIEKNINNKTRAIICVHLAGLPCNIKKLNKIAKKYKLFLIEDCSQAHGALYRGKSVGTFGDIGAWSFCQDKIISTGGEGGMLTTNNKKIFEKVFAFRDHGKSYFELSKKTKKNQYRWIHDDYGSNLRMTEVQSALGSYQIKKLERWRNIRKRNALEIRKVFREFPDLIRVDDIPSHVTHAWYRCYVHVKDKSIKGGWNREKILGALNKIDVPCFVGACPELYLEKNFIHFSKKKMNRLPNAKKLGETSLAFLTHP
ncbi:DegT/DnrJ/EryC1/StrS family aminotransferase, partial [Pelagibacteraceae bacterium]|nr:DegT/DnrJ/EryC1/StrS family aminotransferase [Pelagibacteraceae bacterium]